LDIISIVAYYVLIVIVIIFILDLKTANVFKLLFIPYLIPTKTLMKNILLNGKNKCWKFSLLESSSACTVSFWFKISSWINVYLLLILMFNLSIIWLVFKEVLKIRSVQKYTQWSYNTALYNLCWKRFQLHIF